MKHLKQKLILATAMMLLAAVMLSSVSFAWYTLSTNPEIKGMSATVSSNENLEIALWNTGDTETTVDTRSEAAAGEAQGSANGNPYTWGNQIDLTDKINSVTLEPVRYSAGSFQYPQYGLDGRVANFADASATEYGAYGAYAAGITNYSSTEANAFSVTYWVRSNVSGTLSLTTATKRAGDGNNSAAATDVNGVVGTGSKVTGLSASLRNKEYFKVAFAVGDSTDLVVADLDDEGNLSCSEITELTANTAVKITMYVFLDGTKVTNEQAALADETITVDVQFANSGVIVDANSGAMTGVTAPTVEP